MKSTRSLPQGFLLSLRGSLQQSDRGDEGTGAESGAPRVEAAGSEPGVQGLEESAPERSFPPLEQPFRLQSIFTVLLGAPGTKAGCDFTEGENEFKPFNSFAPS